MGWTIAWPKKLGWYWLRYEIGFDRLSFPVAVRVSQIGPGDRLDIDGLIDEHIEDKTGQFFWYGPIEPPPRVPSGWDGEEDGE